MDPEGRSRRFRVINQKLKGNRLDIAADICKAKVHTNNDYHDTNYNFIDVIKEILDMFCLDLSD